MLKAKLQSYTLQDSVYNEIFEEIISGKLPPGTRITIGGLAKKFGVSEQPVREAIHRLAAQKLILTRNRQIWVQSLSEEDFINILNVYKVLFEYTISDVVDKLGSEELKIINNILAEMKTCDDMASTHRCGRKLLNSIIEFSGNPALYDTTQFILNRLDPYLSMGLKNIPFKAKGSEMFIKNWENIISNIVNKDKNAPKIATKMLFSQVAIFRKGLARTKLFQH